MRVLARVHLYPPEHCAGAERMLQALLEELADQGHAVVVHLAKPTITRKPYYVGKVQVHPMGSGEDWVARAQQADVLITHLDQTSEVVSASIMFGKPLVQVLHNTHAPTRMWASCKADLLVYNSEWMAGEMGRHPNGIVVRPPVRVRDYAVDPPAPGNAGKVTLINLTQIKGGVLFAQLAALMPDVEFLGVRGAYGEQLNPRLPNVEIRPHGQDMREVYADTSILLIPSPYESWGRVGVEAMCSGIPVIATPTPGLAESLGDAGLFCNYDDIGAWRDAIDYLRMVPGVYAKQSVLARDRALELDPTDDLARFTAAVEALA